MASQNVAASLGSPRRRERPYWMDGSRASAHQFRAIRGCISVLARALHAALATSVMLAGVTACKEPASRADTSPPTQPGAITVSNLTATSAQLSWARSTDDVGVVG
jgi:hypothetical protein